ncbi:hypothetical protein MY10362_000287 [Beauveria mimosiformis]
MAPSASKANYKTYEAQARLVRAIVAAHPSTKWNYKVIDCCSAEIAACYGSDMTEHALNHRFRHIRAQTEVILEGRKVNLDVKNLTTDESSLPKTVGAVDKKNIAKYFGQSTGDGIQFQFRTIKKDADKMRAMADGGGDPSTCLDLGTSSGSSFTPTSTPKTSRSRNVSTPSTAGGGGSTAKRSRGGPPVVKIESDDDDLDSESTHNWSEMESTPSKRPRKFDATGASSGQKTGTPRLAAARASATITDFSAQLQTSESEAETPAYSMPEFSAHAPNGAGSAVRPSSSFATAAATAAAPARSLAQQQQPQQRATPSLFGNVPEFQQTAPLSAPTSTAAMVANSNPFRNSGTDVYLGAGGSHRAFGTPAADSAFYDDDDPIDGEC